jgi:hypothetical protein
MGLQLSPVVAGGGSGGGGGSSTFIGLTDVPASYSGQALKVARVNAGETALEFATVSGTGDVVGPASSTDNAIVRFDGATGKLIQNYTSGAPTVGDTGAITATQGGSLTGTWTDLGSVTTIDINGGTIDGTPVGNTTPSTVTTTNTGLHILDTNASHDLVIVPGSDLTADRNLTLTTGDAARTITINSDATISSGTAVSAVQIMIDGGGSVITTGVKGYIEIPFACTINQVTLLADQSGSIVVDIWKDTYANYPPTVADTITAAAKPTISSATKSQDATLTGWTTSVTAGDILGFNVDSATTVQRVTLSLKVTKT